MPRTKPAANAAKAEAKSKKATKAGSPARAPRKPAKAPKGTGARKQPHTSLPAALHTPQVTESQGSTEKRVMGRPTKYDPAFCDIAIELGKLGKSGEVIACHIGVVYQTMLNWANEHPDFLEAIALAKQLEMLWWEDAGQNYLTTTGFSASAWSRSMAARFPNKWRESKELVGANGGPLIPVINMVHTSGGSGGQSIAAS